MLVTITNISSGQVDVPTIHKTLAASESVTFSRTPAQVEAEVGLKQLVVDGKITMTFTAEASDAVNTGAVVAGPAVDSAGLGDLMVIRKAFTAGVTGTADDVTIYSAAVPCGMRIVDAMIYVSTAKAGATVTLRSATGGGGSALSDDLSVAATGVVRNATLTATTTLSSGGTLVLRRSDRACAGEVVIFCQKI